MIDKPGDVVMFFGLAALAITVFGFGYMDVLEANSSVSTTSFYSDFGTYVNGSQYFKGASDDSSTALSGLEGSSGGNSDSFIVQMGLALLKIGKIWGAMWDALQNLSLSLHIPPEILTIVMGMILVTMAIAIYQFWRGN